MARQALLLESSMYQPMTAGDVCTRDTVFVYPQMALNEAARLMREQHVGSLVVIDETTQGRVPVGMVTDRDIVTAVVAKDLDARLLRVGDVMSTDLLTAREADPVSDVVAAMKRKGVRRVPVTDARGTLAGVLALDDVLAVVAEQLRALTQVVESEKAREKRIRA